EHQGVVAHADVPLADLAGGLEVGQALRARPVRQRADGAWEFSLQRLLPSPWDRVLEELQVGDVGLGRVDDVKDYGAFVEVLPGVAGLVHVSELDWDRVDAVAEHVRPGQVVPVKLLAFDRDRRRLELSIKRALGTDPRPSPALVPDGSPFRW